MCPMRNPLPRDRTPMHPWRTIHVRARANRTLHAGKEHRRMLEFGGVHLNARRDLASGLRTSDHNHAHRESPWSLQTWGQVSGALRTLFDSRKAALRQSLQPVVPQEGRIGKSPTLLAAILDANRDRRRQAVQIGPHEKCLARAFAIKAIVGRDHGAQVVGASRHRVHDQVVELDATLHHRKTRIGGDRAHDAFSSRLDQRPDRRVFLIDGHCGAAFGQRPLHAAIERDRRSQRRSQKRFGDECSENHSPTPWQFSILYFVSNNMQSPCRRRAGVRRQIPQKKFNSAGSHGLWLGQKSVNVRFIKGNQNETADLFCRPAANPPPLVLGRTYGRSRLRSAAPVSRYRSGDAQLSRSDAAEALSLAERKNARPDKGARFFVLPTRGVTPKRDAAAAWLCAQRTAPG